MVHFPHAFSRERERTYRVAADLMHAFEAHRWSDNVRELKNLALLCMWLFHLHSAMKNRAFFKFSPWRAPRLRHFSGYPFGVSRKKASTIFYNTAKNFIKYGVGFGGHGILTLALMDARLAAPAVYTSPALGPVPCRSPETESLTAWGRRRRRKRNEAALGSSLSGTGGTRKGKRRRADSASASPRSIAA